MAFRYQHNGEERVAKDVAELERALRAGEIDKTTVVTDDAVGARLQAGAVIAMNRRSAPAPAKPDKPFKLGKPEKEPTSKRLRNHQLIAVGIGIAALFVWSGMGIPPYLVGEMTGRSAVILLVVVVLCGAIFGKKTEGQRIRLAWMGLATWLVLILGQAYLVAEARDARIASDKAAIKALADSTRKSAAEMETLLGEQKPGATPAPAPAPAPAPSSPAPAPAGTSLLAKIAPIAATSQAASIKEMREWQAFQSTLGLEIALTPANLASPDGRKRNKEMFNRYISEFEAHLGRLEAVLVRHREQLLALVENDRGKAAFTQGVDNSLNQTRSGYEEMRQNQRKLMVAMHSLNDFMSARGGTVTLQRDKLVFTTDADVDGYNKLVGRIVELSEEEEAITKKQLDRVKGAADRIEKMNPK